MNKTDSPDNMVTTTGSAIMSSDTPSRPYPTLDLHTDTKWVLAGFLVFSPIISAVFLAMHIRMEHKKTNILNIQLAIINMLSSAILLPMFFSFYLLFGERGEKFVSPWSNEKYVNVTFCGSLAMTFYVLTSLHFTTLFALSLDRMVAVYMPFKYRRIRNSHYFYGLGILWVFTIILPLLGFFVVVGDPIPHESAGVKQLLPRKLFQFLPHGLINDQNVFCEISFREMVLDPNNARNMADFNPDTLQKAYCFFMMVIPYVVVPLLTVTAGLTTLLKIATLDSKRRSLEEDNTTKRHFVSYIKRIYRKKKNVIDETEMIYENKSPENSGDATKQKTQAVLLKLNRLPSRRRIDGHFQALATVIMLLILFCLCDSLWWIINVSYALKYIFNKSFLSVTAIFRTADEQVVFPIIARFGIFIYNTLLPPFMLWRRKPLRDELLSMFRGTKTRGAPKYSYFSSNATTRNLAAPIWLANLTEVLMSPINGRRNVKEGEEGKRGRQSTASTAV